jgi:hypothetical protein
MPYITKDRRRDISDHHEIIKTPGELNYLITMMAKAYLGDMPTYKDYNEVIGVLECAKLELYRRIVAPYEDTKCSQNGDVY